MRARSWGALAAALAVAAGVGACGGTEEPPQASTVAIVMPGQDNGLDWTRLARRAFEEVVDDRGLTGLVAADVQPDHLPRALEQLAGDGAQLVVAHDPAYARAAARAAADEKLPVLVWGDRGALREGLVGDVEVAAAEAGYAAGQLVAQAAIEPHVAVLVAAEGTAWEARTWNEMAGGFVAGARNHDPDIHIELRWVGDAGATDPAAMERAAQATIDRGAQAVFALGGRATDGAFTAARRAPSEQVFAGAIGDRATVDDEHDVVTSIVFDFEELFARAVLDLRAGRFGREPYVLSLANGGLELLATGRTPSDAHAAALAVAERIDRGEIEPPRTATRAQVRALLTAGAGG